MKKVTFLALSCLFVMMANFYTAKSQLDCTIDDACGVWAPGSDTIRIILNAPECKILIVYEWRICNGVYEYSYGTPIATGNCVQMADFSIYEYDFSSILEMADMIIAEEVGQMNNHPVATDCSIGTVRKMKRYAASCGVWVKCSYKVDVNATVYKDRGYVGECPARDENDFIDVWKWQSCGETCCSRTYDICTYTSPIHGSSEVRVTQYPAVQVGECTEQGNYGPWDDLNTDYQCRHGC